MFSKFKLGLSLLLFTLCFFFGRQFAAFADSIREQNTLIIILDAGHGGRDPGKVGINQTLEKDINLEIVRKLQHFLENKGYHVVLTRTDEKDLSSENSSNHKMEDLKKRISIMKENHADLVISIHQNSFQDTSTCGPQVFYYEPDEQSHLLASAIQTSLDENLNIETSRGIKANHDYYLFKNSPAPIIIVECGFLSNPTEAELLSTDDYQFKIARFIYAGIREYLSQKGTIQDLYGSGTESS